jgi:hypothetical protein
VEKSVRGGVIALETLLAIKLLYTAFMAVLIPVYLHQYGWTNFLYFCDLALLFTLAGLWLDNPLLISMCAVGLLLPQALWVVDYIFNLFGLRTTGLTNYMFESHRSLFLRGLSLFHGWLPFLLAFLAWRLGYDRRGWLAWSELAVALLLICFFLMPPPHPNPGLTPVNINYVWGTSDNVAQTFVHPYVWLGGMMIGLPLILFWPVHLLLSRYAPKPI